MKALNNFVAAAGYSAVAEALPAGKRFGLDGTRMIEVLNASTGRNFNTEIVMQEHVVNRRFATGFSLDLLAKDVHIAADLMRSVALDAPLAQLMTSATRWRACASAMDATIPRPSWPGTTTTRAQSEHGEENGRRRRGDRFRQATSGCRSASP